MKTNNIIIIVVLLVIVAAGGFFTGMKYQQNQQPAFGRNFGGAQAGRTGGTNRNNFRPVSGDILSADDKSITVKLQDGSSKIVLISASTTINKAAQGTLSDLKVGERVAVVGQDNTDGSVTAQSVQLNPTFRGGPDQTPIPGQNSPSTQPGQ
jgi:flagellar basal body-associated protein FliL